MKKITKGLVFLSSVALLTGCNAAHLKYSLKEVHRNIDALKETGILLDLEMSNYEMSTDGELASGKVTYGQKAGVAWAIFEGTEGEETVHEGIAVDDTEDAPKFYQYNVETEQFDRYTFEDEDQKKEAEDGYKTVNEMVNFILSYANTVSGLLMDNGTDEVAGRPCSKYSFAFNNVLAFFGAEADIDLYVDDATGITLKASHNIYAAGEEGEFTFEITRLETSGVVIPALND